MALYKKLFKLNSNGKSIQAWEIHRSEDCSEYWTISGQTTGKQTKSSPHAVKPKVNRSPLEQITLEMNAKVTLQTRKKYVENIDDVGKKADSVLPGYSAMLAKKWENQKKKIKFPCSAQPKLDGIRCLATKDGLFSRGRKEIEACQHVRDALKPFFDKYPDAHLDGELYAHEFKDDFETIIKAVRKSMKHAKQEHLELQSKVQYHIYDFPRIGGLHESAKFIEREMVGTRLLMEEIECAGYHHKSIRILGSKHNIRDEDELCATHSSFCAGGYEGTMVRNTAMPYEGKRSNNLLKMKDFDDDEFKIIGVKEGLGGLVGHAASFILVTKEGVEFKAKLTGSFERLKWIFNNPTSVIGKMATVKYQGITNKNNVPRFPVAKDIRGFEDRKDWL